MAQSIVVKASPRDSRSPSRKPSSKLAVNAVKRKPLSDSFTALNDISFPLEEGDSHRR